MAEQIILAVDKNGKFLEYIPKSLGHQGNGKRHLAITVLLFNLTGQVLLQKRKHQLFDQLWDLTGATHPLHKSDGTDETVEQATLRCLKEEWGISPTSPGLRGVKKIGVFNYFAPYHTVQGEFCENEHCVMMVGEYNGEIKMDPQVGYEYKWMGKNEFLKDIQSHPQIYTPWAIKAVKILRN